MFTVDVKQQYNNNQFLSGALVHPLCIIIAVFVFFSVYADGSICLDILQNRWSPTYDVSAILTSIQVSSIITEKVRK